MKAAVMIALLIAAVPGLAADAVGQAQQSGARCGLARVESIVDLKSELSRRAVDVVRISALTGRANKDRLEQLVNSRARFSLGSGDVGQPMGAGIAGARAMAR